MDDTFMDIIDIPETPNVPKFEQDLQEAGGDISTLVKEKENKNKVSFDEIDTNSLKYEEELPVQRYDNDNIRTDNIRKDADDDFIYDDDGFSGNLDEISAEDIALDDMYVKAEEKSPTVQTEKKTEEKISDVPKTEDMSKELALNAKKTEELVQKDILDNSEKEFIKNRLKAEIESKPEGYDQKKSIEMYRRLMAEQKEKQAKHGFSMLILTAIFGILAAAALFVLNNKSPEACGKLPSLNIFVTGAVFFSAAMLVRAKLFRLLSALFFIVSTAVLAGLGLFGYISSGASSENGFAVNVLLYAAAIIFSAAAAVRLAVNKDIKAYYDYKPEKDFSHRG